jgi:sulfate transport system ATP-binding protein
VSAGRAHVGGVDLPASGVAEGAAEIFIRPADLAWSVSGGGIAAVVSRVIDRPDGRRLLARLDDGTSVEIDVPPDTKVRAEDRGVIEIKRANVFSLAG